jgi:hypothetical protein
MLAFHLPTTVDKEPKKISHTRRSPKDRNYPSTPFDKLPIIKAPRPIKA